MKFSFVLGETEYVEAMIMSNRRNFSFKIIAGAVFLMAAILVIQMTVVPVWIASLANPSGAGEWAFLSWSLIWGVFVHCGVLALFAALPIAYWRLILLPNGFRKRYRANSNFQSRVTAEIGVEGVCIETAHPSMTKDNWNCVKNWRMGKRVLLLSHPWGTMHMINISSLSEARREELRAILRSAVPTK